MNPEIRELFPATESLVYLNSAAVAPLPKASADAVIQQLRDVSLNGSTNYSEWVATKGRCRNLVAELLNVRSDQIAFLRNTSDGFAAVANGITWKPGDNIVSFIGEFPSNFYPWRMVRDRYGVDLRLCKESGDGFNIDEFISLIDRSTRLVTVSAVQFSSGFRADLERIGEAAKRHDALFSVDMIQAFGARSLDLDSLGVDVASGASHKWLCSPEGCGILFLSDRALSEITPSLVGWISVEHPWDFIDLEQPFHPNSLAFESGTGPASLFYGLEASLQMLKGVGIGNIQKHIDELTGLLCENLQDTRFTLRSSRRENEKSQIVAIQHSQGISPNEIFHSLEKKGIVISARGDKLRISPHLFNNSEDISILLDALKEF